MFENMFDGEPISIEQHRESLRIERERERRDNRVWRAHRVYLQAECYRIERRDYLRFLRAQETYRCYIEHKQASASQWTH